MPAEQETPTLEELLARGEVKSALLLKGEFTERERGMIRQAWEAGLASSQAELQAAQEREKKLNRSIVAHHNIATLSDEAIREGLGAPGGCPICAAAQRTEEPRGANPDAR